MGFFDFIKSIVNKFKGNSDSEYETNMDDGDMKGILKTLSLTGDDILNIAEQVGLFEEINLTDKELIAKICDTIANDYNSSDKQPQTLKALVEKVLAENGYSAKSALNLIPDAFISSYVYIEE